MPMYEYACLTCRKRFELLRSSAERDEACACTHCGAEKKHLRIPSLFSNSSGPSLSGSSCGPSPSGGFG